MIVDLCVRSDLLTFCLVLKITCSQFYAAHGSWLSHGGVEKNRQSTESAYPNPFCFPRNTQEDLTLRFLAKPLYSLYRSTIPLYYYSTPFVP